MNLSTPKRSEVDMRVAQELKNHLDFVNQTNQAIQKLSSSIVSLSLLHEKAIAKSAKDGQDVAIAFEVMSEKVWSICQDCEQRMNNLEARYGGVYERLEKAFNSFSADFLTIDYYMKSSSYSDKRLDALEVEFKNKQDNLSSSIDKLQGSLKEHVANLRKDMPPKPPEVDPLKLLLEERFQAFKVDCNGLVKEIALIKRDVAYDQKKFENIYTLIERLKAGNP